MLIRVLRFFLAVATFALLVVPSRSADQTLIAPGASWKFNDKGIDLGTTWRASAYNDSAWTQGNAQLGYGDGDEATAIGFGSSSSRYVTYYFRRSFTVADVSSISALTLRYLRDDGCVIYVNGVEAVRSNLPTGTISYSTLATTAIGGIDETTWLQTALSKSLLVNGTNVIAVEIHQQAASSTDVSFDLELRATTISTAPTVTLVSPGNLITSNASATTFTANATGPLRLGERITADRTSSANDDVERPRSSRRRPDHRRHAHDAQWNGSFPKRRWTDAAHAHSLIRFPTLLGQVPAGSTITSATLRLNCTNSGNVMQAYQLTESWNEDQASWNERQIGLPWSNPGADGASSNAGVATPADCTATGLRSIDITSFVQQWSNGSPNYGLVLTDSGTDGIDFSSSESATSPTLTVIYRLAPQIIETKPLSGTSASVSFNASLPIGQTYLWNIRVTDIGGQQSTAPSDFQVTIDAASPDAPVLISPANGSTGASANPTLAVNVSSPGGGAVTANFQLRQPPRLSSRSSRCPIPSIIPKRIRTSTPRRPNGSCSRKRRATSCSSPTKATSSRTFRTSPSGTARIPA